LDTRLSTPGVGFQFLHIPDEGDQRSGVMSITVPGGYPDRRVAGVSSVSPQDQLLYSDI
jgi:hypothetical protein